MSTPNVYRPLALLLLALGTSLTGCATQSVQPRPVSPPRVPPPPAELMVPPSPGTYSDSVRELFLQWQKLLTPASPA